MEVVQPTAKIYTSHCQLEADDFRRAFHRWIADRRIPGVLLIDVADYSHVHDGPGVLLVAHEIFLGMDRGDGRLGMQVRRRRGGPVPAAAGMAEATKLALTAAIELEKDFPGKVRFAPAELVVGCNDRLRAPNTAAVFAQLAEDLEDLAVRLFPDDEHTLSQAGDPKSCFRARLEADGEADLATLLGRLS